MGAMVAVWIVNRIVSRAPLLQAIDYKEMEWVSGRMLALRARSDIARPDVDGCGEFETQWTAGDPDFTVEAKSQRERFVDRRRVSAA